jgi:hypothetical protein
VNEPSHTASMVLPLEAERRIDRDCDRFEAQWQAGQRPRLEDHLAQAAGPERLVRLCQLGWTCV